MRCIKFSLYLLFVSPFELNKTKDALLDLSLNHERLLEDHQRVLNQLARSEGLVRAYCCRKAAGTSELHSSGARTWSATSSRRRGSVNQQLEGDNDADPRPRRLPLFQLYKVAS